MGGIQYAADALEFLIAGASALAIGTSLFVDPRCIVSIREGIEDYLQRHGFSRLGEIVGSLSLP
jgi:dihydroorotate dehydrogenase (NAD+) catalytic subunit